jgi:hypothetical protein
MSRDAPSVREESLADSLQHGTGNLHEALPAKEIAVVTTWRLFSGSDDWKGQQK